MIAYPAILLLAAAAPVTPSAPPIAHSVRLDHRSGAVDARYRGMVDIAHRQIGTAGPPGTASTLRCHWTAALRVDREARAPAGLAARSFRREGAIGGSRPGWCAGSRAAIAAEVAARSDELHGHVRAMAREDHPVLHAELDRLHIARADG